jgi:hypothetical protein
VETTPRAAGDSAPTSHQPASTMSGKTAADTKRRTYLIPRYSPAAITQLLRRSAQIADNSIHPSARRVGLYGCRLFGLSSDICQRRAYRARAVA